jgi:hypothetical protein
LGIPEEDASAEAKIPVFDNAAEPKDKEVVKEEAVDRDSPPQ